MRKSLATLIVSLLLCGGATAAVIAADETPSNPVKVAMVTPSTPVMLHSTLITLLSDAYKERAFGSKAESAVRIRADS